jgi:hypothetical protein
MNATDFALGSGRSVAEVLAAAELSPGAGDALAAAGDPREFVDRLIVTGNLEDAIAFIAHALPPREGTWWAWLCARAASGAAPPQAVEVTLEATRRWIAEPSDEHRRAAFACAEVAGLGTAVGLAALGAFLCGDSLAPANVPAVPPAEFDASKAIAGAVMLAAVESQPDDAAGAMNGFLQQGLELADRRRLWQPPATNAS